METVIIIGAGPAGLTAAYQLLKSDNKYEVIVIEKDSQVGGISKTSEYKGNRIDLGGHRFFSKSKTVNSIWLELLSEQGVAISESLEPPQKEEYKGCANPDREDDVMLVRRRISRIYYRDKLFDYPLSINWNTLKNMGIGRTICCGIGYIWSVFFKRKENSLEDFYINHFGKPLYQMFFQDYTTKLWGVSPSQLAPDWGSQRVKKLSLAKAVKDGIFRKVKKDYVTEEVSLIEEFYYPKYGPGQLWEKMASKITCMGGKIFLNAACQKIVVDENRVTKVVFKDKESKTNIIDGNYVISSMAIKDLINSIEPKAPQSIKDITELLPYRSFITVGVLVKKLNINNTTRFSTYSNLIPDCWIYVQEKNIKMGRMQIFNNWSPYMVAKPRDTVWIGLEYFCTEGDAFWSMSKENFCKFAVEELIKMKIVCHEQVLDTVVYKVPKAYPAYYGSYKEMPKVIEYLEGFENILCVGRNGQHHYNNMDHSMMTGMLAAEAIQGKVKKNQVWNVNTECEYHEGT